jgi:uncharacterized protein
MRFPTRARIVTMALAAGGAAAFWVAGLPLPFLFGPMVACLAAALSGVRLQGMGQVSGAARTILGVAVGASLTPAVMGQVPQMLASIALIPVYVAVIGLVGVPFFRRMGFDPVTSWYAAMPGGLQDMVQFGAEAGGDVRALSLIQATRVLMIVSLAPLILTGLYGVSLTRPIGDPASALPLSEMAIMAAAALIGWKGGERIGLFGASIIGPLILTAALSLTDVIHHRPPAEAILIAQLFIGMGIGVHYVGITWAELRRFVAAGVAFVLLLAVLATVFAELVVWLGLAGSMDAFLAFAPAGQAEMTVLAIVVGADLGFVVLHHLTRMVIIILGAPVAARLLRVRRA